MVWVVLLSVSILSFLIGFLVKFVDFLEDDLKVILNKNKSLGVLRKLSLPLGVLYGLLIAIVVVLWPILFPLAIGTILGEILARKIDVIGHLIALFLFVLLCAFLISLGLLNVGLNLSFVALALAFFAASILDEFADKYSEKFLGNSSKRSFFSLRPFLEITAFLVSLFLNEWIIWVTIFSFDVAYVLSTKLLPKVFLKK
ncbi:MAG: hypothetical protein WCW44_02145 [archaeon]|jgi:hypothetical protein